MAGRDVVCIQGVPVTSALRTCFDLSRDLPLVEAVVLVDLALHRKTVNLDEFRQYVAQRKGWRRVAQARSVAEAAEPSSESPMESRLRMALLGGGLPRPEAQAPIYDDNGWFVGRLDLFYRAAKLGIEYDGSTHRDSLVADNRRQNLLLRAGITLLRYTASDLYHHPSQLVAQVRAELTSRKAPGLSGF